MAGVPFSYKLSIKLDSAYPVASFASGDPYAAALPRLEKALAGQHVHGAPVWVTGATILSSGGRGGGNSVLAETLLAGLGALVVLPSCSAR